MNTRLLCVMIFALATLIFWGNYSTAQKIEIENGKQFCRACKCAISMTVKNPDPKKQPSCSVVFNLQKRPPINSNDQWYLESLVKTDEVTQHVEAKFMECDFTVYCDPGGSADLTCEEDVDVADGIIDMIFGTTTAKKEYKTTHIWQNQKCPVYCEKRGEIKDVNIKCDVWPGAAKKPPVKPPTPAKKPPPPKTPAAKKPGKGTTASMFFGVPMDTMAPLSWFVPAAYTVEFADENEDTVEAVAEPQSDSPKPRGIINDLARWKSPNGDAGFEQGSLIVAKGEAEAQSFCTGDSIKVRAPNLVSLPTCERDVTGFWEGAYARPRPKGVPPNTPRETISMSLNLRSEKGSLVGELKSPNGTFTISGQQHGANVGLVATATTGTQAKISLQGKLTNGSIVFGGDEQSPEGVKIYRLIGYARRLHIADAALPVALVNTPYNFALTAFAPGGQALTFRLANPTEPEEIAWKMGAESLKDRNGERFTYRCPANGSPGMLWGTDVYEASSSICGAAAHRGVITVKTGGVVTIQIQSGAQSYTRSTRNGISSKSYGSSRGSFVLVSGDAAGGERGRLPKGLSFDASSGTFSGTPTETGSFDLMIVAADGAGNQFELPVTLMVKEMVITNGLLHDGFAGLSYSATLNVIGGQPPYRFSAAKMPNGLQLDPDTGAVSGTPPTPISLAKVEVTVRDSQNKSESQTVTLTMRSATILGSHYLPDARVGVPYKTQFQTTGSPSVRLWTLYGTDARLIGLQLNEQTGELSGTPIKSGTYFLNVRAEAGMGVPNRGFSLTIQ